MKVQLTNADLLEFVKAQVEAGYFSSPNEVIEAALAHLMLDPVPEAIDAETLAAIDRAEAEFDRGEDRSFAQVAAELRERFKRQR